MAINEEWHRRNVMPRNATLDERIRWHEAHADACGCRPIPDGLRGEIRKRKRRGH